MSTKKETSPEGLTTLSPTTTLPESGTTLSLASICLSYSIDTDDDAIRVTDLKEERQLDPVGYSDWTTGATVFIAQAAFSGEPLPDAFAAFDAWSSYAGANYSRDGCQYLWTILLGTFSEQIKHATLNLREAGMLGDGEETEVGHTIADCSAKFGNIAQYTGSPTIPTTPREAATDTLLQLYKQGMIQTSDAIGILVANERCMLGPGQLQNCQHAMSDLVELIHGLNHQWWHDLHTGEKLERNDGELLMLMVSEIAEGLEGLRKNLMDDHLPHRKMIACEMADAVIRIFDYCGGRGIDLGAVMLEKLGYNTLRADHKRDNRLAADGKKF